MLQLAKISVAFVVVVVKEKMLFHKLRFNGYSQSLTALRNGNNSLNLTVIIPT